MRYNNQKNQYSYLSQKEPVHKHQLTSVGKQPSHEEQERKRRLEESVFHFKSHWLIKKSRNEKELNRD
jgi:hypothetical protein